MICLRRLQFFLAVAAVVAASTWASVPSLATAQSKPGATPGRVDPFVTSAPLIVGAICSDGVALIALHTSFADEPLLLDADEPLLESEDDTQGTSDIQVDNSATKKSSNGTISIGDVPRSYRGPFRISAVDGFGTGMVCAGWRSHGQLMVDYCRDLAKEELQVFGPPRMTTTYCQEYGRYLAQQTSAWMAYSAILRKNAWSCVGLLATVSPTTEAAPSTGWLWLVDATGAYRIRAHAVGGGGLAGIVNHYLAQRPIMSAEQTMREVLDLLSQQTALLPSGTRAELAIIGPDSSKKVKLQRVFLTKRSGVMVSNTQ